MLFPVVGCERADVDETDHGFVACCGFGDHKARVGVSGEDDGLADASDHIAHVGGVARGDLEELVCKCGMTPFQLADYAKAPCTSTTVGF
jgi:hypothetical protein